MSAEETWFWLVTWWKTCLFRWIRSFQMIPPTRFWPNCQMPLYLPQNDCLTDVGPIKLNCSSSLTIHCAQTYMQTVNRPCTLHSPTVHIQCTYFFNQFYHFLNQFCYFLHQFCKIGWEKCVHWMCTVGPCSAQYRCAQRCTGPAHKIKHTGTLHEPSESH